MAPLEQHLVQVGVHLLESGGPDRLGLREIARQAGVSHGAPRRYFPTHRQLLVAIARSGLTDLTRILKQALPERGRAEDRLIAVSFAYLDFATERPEMFRLMFRHDILSDRETSRSGAALREIWLPLLGEVARVIENGFPKVDDARERALLIWTHVHGLATFATGLTLEPAGFEGRIRTLVERAVRVQLPQGPQVPQKP